MEFKFVDEKNRIPEVGEWFYFDDNEVEVIDDKVLFVRIESQKGAMAIGHNQLSDNIYMVALETKGRRLAGNVYWNSKLCKNFIIVESDEPIYLKRKQS